MSKLILSGSVGAGGKNDPADVERVNDRLVELGFGWVAGMLKGTEPEFVKTIKLFRSIVNGKGKVEGEGKISRLGNTHKWLAAQNAPQWVKISGDSGIGWTSTNAIKPGDYKESNGGFTTSWLRERLAAAGVAYRAKALVTVDDAPPLWVRECSPEKGGDANGHKSHETGIDVDIRLPLLPPHTNDWIQLKAHNYTKLFHFDAGMEQCKAIRFWMNPKHVFFNDPRFISAGLTSHEANHSEHYHVRIRPPARIDGIFF
jgi:hypothetical protein